MYKLSRLTHKFLFLFSQTHSYIVTNSFLLLQTNSYSQTHSYFHRLVPILTDSFLFSQTRPYSHIYSFLFLQTRSYFHIAVPNSYRLIPILKDSLPFLHTRSHWSPVSYLCSFCNKFRIRVLDSFDKPFKCRGSILTLAWRMFSFVRSTDSTTNGGVPANLK